MTCNIRKKFFAELLGTFFLVFFGTGSAVVTLLISDATGIAGIGLLGGLGDWIAITLAFGLTVMICIYVFGKISGAHLNPAVTIGLLVTKNIDLADSVYYILAQVIGACLGSLFLFLCLGMSSMIAEIFYYPIWLAGAVLAVLYAISLFFGTLPILSLLRKTPSEILAKYDI